MSYESKLLEHLKLNKPVEIRDTFKICDNSALPIQPIFIIIVHVVVITNLEKSQRLEERKGRASMLRTNETKIN